MDQPREEWNMRAKMINVLLFITVAALLSQSALAETFSLADFTGTWYGHKVVSGDAPTDTPRWGYGVITFGSAGNYTVSGWVDSASVPVNPNGTMDISPTGVVTIANEPSIHGIMNEDKNLVVFTDGKSLGNGLTIMIKRTSTTFAPADLAGIWYGYQVVTGDVSNGDEPRWGYGTVTMNGSGSYTANWNSATSAGEITSGAVQIDANGIIRINNDTLTHGAMSDDKKLFVLTNGSSENDGNGLMVFIKRAPGNSFNLVDFEGKWCGNHVVSGDNPPDDPRWGYGSVTIDGTGNLEATWTSPTQTDEVTQGTIQINGLGLVTIGNDPLINGAMSDDKSLMVIVDGSSTSGGNILTLITRCESPKVPTGQMLLLLTQ